MKIALLTLGCKVNQAEMGELESEILGRGHEVVGLDGSPDLCVVNTCAVTAKSDYQSRQMIRRASRSGARVIVTGCYSELRADEIRGMEGVSEVIGNANKTRIIDRIHALPERNTLSKSARTRFSLKVQDGCDRSCSYCIVPKARGRPTSVPVGEVIERVRGAEAAGYKEVVLTGVHLGLYGTDIGSNLAILLDNILEKTTIPRVRLSSLEATELDSRLLDCFKNKRICRHLHVPLQSGSDGVLRLMNRSYNTAFYKEKILEATSLIENVSIGADVIVGFPHETGGDFDETYRFVEGLPMAYLHVFQFSKRPGTPAFDMPDTVTSHEKRQRSVALRRLSARKKSAYINRHLGAFLDVLIETEVSGSEWLGTSSNYLKVRVRGANLTKGSIVLARVEGQDNGVAFGERISGP